MRAQDRTFPTAWISALISKMQPAKYGEGGSRLAIVLNGSPQFTGAAGTQHPVLAVIGPYQPGLRQVHGGPNR